MQVEHVAGECLTARRAPQQQRHLAIGVSLLGEVVVNAQGVLAVVEEVLRHGGTRVRGQILERGAGGCRCHNHGRVLHGAGLAQTLHNLGDGRCLLADGHVEALHVLAALVDDRVDRDRRLAGLAVADDELALATANRDKCVDGLDTGLKRLGHRLALHHTRGLELHGAELGGGDWATAVERHAKRVNHAAEECLAHRNLNDLAGAADGVALLDEGVLAKQHDADVVLLEVQGQA